MSTKKIIFLSLLIIAILFGYYFYDKLNNHSNNSKNSWTVSFIEKKLSSPDRKVHLEGVTGLLSSKAKIANITIS